MPQDFFENPGVRPGKHIAARCSRWQRPAELTFKPKRECEDERLGPPLSKDRAFPEPLLYADDSQAHNENSELAERFFFGRFGKCSSCEIAGEGDSGTQSRMDLERTASIALEKVRGVSELYNRLLLIAGPVASGKTMLLRRMAGISGYPVLNVGMELSRQMLELTERQRIIELPKRLEDLVSNQGSDVVLLDDTEFLFLNDLKQDALALLKSVSRNHTIVVSWLGTRDHEHLRYATPNHPEFKTYPCSGLELIELRR